MVTGSVVWSWYYTLYNFSVGRTPFGWVWIVIVWEPLPPLPSPFWLLDPPPLFGLEGNSNFRLLIVISTWVINPYRRETNWASVSRSEGNWTSTDPPPTYMLLMDKVILLMTSEICLENMIKKSFLCLLSWSSLYISCWIIFLRRRISLLKLVSTSKIRLFRSRVETVEEEEMLVEILSICIFRSSCSDWIFFKDSSCSCFITFSWDAANYNCNFFCCSMKSLYIFFCCSI